MSRKKIMPMKIRDVLRLKFENDLSYRKISKSCNLPRTTVRDYISRANQTGLHWDILRQMSDTELLNVLKPPPIAQPKFEVPIWSEIRVELARKGVTLRLLWEEYIEKSAPKSTCSYSWFCEHFRVWCKSKDLWMRQNHKAGEYLFVDYSGMTLTINLPNSEKTWEAELFIAVLGASQKCFENLSKSQTLKDWLLSHCLAFEYFGGVPELIVPDNLKSGVTHPHRYDPEINKTFHEMAKHYGVAVMPARAYKPKDKSKAEGGVQFAQRRILAPLRNQTFFSLDEANQAVQLQLEKLNHEPFQKLPGTRASQFDDFEKSALKPLPAMRYQFAHWLKAKVDRSHHVRAFNHFYSVPYQFASQNCEIRATDSTIECFINQQRVASHVRSNVVGKATTIDAHRPEAHRQQTLWNAERLQAWALGIGPETNALIAFILGNEDTHMKIKERHALGILRLSNAYTDVRLEAACQHASAHQIYRYPSIKSILKNGLDQRQQALQSHDLPQEHENVRGPGYYH